MHFRLPARRCLSGALYGGEILAEHREEFCVVQQPMKAGSSEENEKKEGSDSTRMDTFSRDRGRERAQPHDSEGERREVD